MSGGAPGELVSHSTIAQQPFEAMFFFELVFKVLQESLHGQQRLSGSCSNEDTANIRADKPLQTEQSCLSRAESNRTHILATMPSIQDETSATTCRMQSLQSTLQGAGETVLPSNCKPDIGPAVRLSHKCCHARMLTFLMDTTGYAIRLTLSPS